MFCTVAGEPVRPMKFFDSGCSHVRHRARRVALAVDADDHDARRPEIGAVLLLELTQLMQRRRTHGRAVREAEEHSTGAPRKSASCTGLPDRSVSSKSVSARGGSRAASVPGRRRCAAAALTRSRSQQADDSTRPS